MGDQRGRSAGVDLPTAGCARAAVARDRHVAGGRARRSDRRPERNRSEQERSLPPEAGAGTRWMPVEDDDLEAAAERYAATLPEWFDIIHMGIGADGHTASLVPGDPVLDVHDRDVAVTDRYEGRRRMTLTYPGLSRARSVLWLVTGSEKREALRRLLRADRSIPAARVPVADQVVVTDASAARDEGP